MTLFAMHGALAAAETSLPTAADVLQAERSAWYGDMSGIIGNDGATDPDFGGTPQAITRLRCQLKAKGRAVCRYLVVAHNRRQNHTRKRLFLLLDTDSWTADLGSKSSPALAEEHAAVNALMNLNNYIAAIEFSDICFGTEEGKQALEPMWQQIESARKSLHDRYPDIIANEGSDTDFVCRRELGAIMDQRHIRRVAKRLIRELELSVND